MKPSNFLHRAGTLDIWSTFLLVISAVVVVVLHHWGAIHRGNPFILGPLLFVFGPLFIARIVVFEFGSQATRDAWDTGAEQALPMILAKKSAIKIKEIHTRTFPRGIQDRGSTGKDITPIVPSAAPMREAGRQSGASVARRQASGSKSGDDSDGDDGEPPHRFYTFASAAQLLDCSPKTLRNKVSAGLIPAPVQTAVGPRFSAAQIAELLSPPPPNPASPTSAPKRRGRGRPRIADGKGVRP